MKELLAKRIMVIDDCPDMRTLLKEYLSWQGHTPIEFSDAAEALRHLRTESEEMIDLVLCDVSLPNVSGLSILKEIKLSFPELPVILISAFEKGAVIQEAL